VEQLEHRWRAPDGLVPRAKAGGTAVLPKRQPPELRAIGLALKDIKKQVRILLKSR
jgi:hypothetical protein